MPKVRTGVLFVAVLASLAGPSSGAQRLASLAPARSGSLGMDYTIAFWTIPFGRTTFDVRFDNAAYRIDSRFQTSGIISALWNASIDANASGQIGPRTVSPGVYDSHYQRGSKHQQVKVSFATGAVPVTYADPPYNTKRYPVTDEQKKDGIDPLSAAITVLTGLHASTSSPCGTVAPVFDGRRRYNIELSYLHDEPVKIENVYSGHAHLCQLRYNQIAGFKPKLLREGRALPPAYAWIAEIPSDSAPLAHHYLVPLKAWTATDFGTVSATLTKMRVEDGPAKS
jgi:Protein of unknown function (DUF3108)